MKCYSSWLRNTAFAAAGLASLTACNDTTNLVIRPNSFVETRLVSNVAGFGALSLDPSLVNPWGIGFGSSGTLFVSNNGTGTSTTYNAAGVKLALAINIPTSGAAVGGAPTGLVINNTTDFAIGASGPASVIYAGEDGVISAWNPSLANAEAVVDNSATGAVYKGIAIASVGGVNFLYATDFFNGRVDVFNTAFLLVASFTDAGIPTGFHPFGIQNISGQLFVTYAKQSAVNPKDDEAGVGNGFVDVFNADGSLAQRFASNGSLNSPWAVALVPSGFGPFSGAILIGNFGDGFIGAYNPTTGAFLDVLRNPAGNPISIDGLWGLTFGPGITPTTLYFASGPNGEANGLLGTLTP